MSLAGPAPVASRRPHTIRMHGDNWDDPYFWLRDRDDPEVLAYLEAENQYTERMMQHTQPLQEQLFAEMRGRIKETDASAPERRGDYDYYTRTEERRQYAIHCRRRAGLDAPEEIVLDENALAEGRPYFRVGAFRVSPDHRCLAYSVDTAGDETYTLFVKDLETGSLLPERVPNTYYSVEWANDSRTLFYNALDQAKRPCCIYRHVVGTDAAQDTLVYHEPDEQFYVWLGKTKSQAYLIMFLKSTSTSEVRYAPADRPDADFEIMHPRQPGMEYWVAHHGDRFLVVTNDGAQNFKLMEAPVANPAKANWREAIPHRDDALLDGVEAFRDFIVLYERKGGLKQIRISRPDFSDARCVSFPEPAYDFVAGDNDDFDASTLRITYSSLVTPDSVVDIDLRSGAWDVKKRMEIPSGYDPSQYQSERLVATAPDGAQVPLSIVYKKDLRRDGCSPLLLHGYGAYGATIEPGFLAKRLSLLDRGWVCALAHIRGGLDLGRAWYDGGRLLNKKNSFTDFIACAEHLIARGYTCRERLAIVGVSAGGLLMGAVVNLRPDLFAAAIAKVPFVDVISTMSDSSLPLVVIEWEQWGNPADKTIYEYMKSYSPYDNVEAKEYPNLLVTAGLNDPRVVYWEPAKWVARLRATQTGDHRLLLRTNLDAGHGGASGRYDALRETAFEYAFLIDSLSEPQPDRPAARMSGT